MDKLMEPSSTLQWVDRTLVKPNDYNPNKVSKQNLELLTQSIFTNGWTLPIVVRPDYTIIDGFHRWTVAGPEWKYVPPSEKDKRTLFERLGGKVLVVIVDHKDKAGNIYGTVTHNRARGTHLLEPMKKIVKELMEEGKSVEEIGKQLGMRPEEIFRLSEFSKEDFLKMMVQEKKNFSKAEYIMIKREIFVIAGECECFPFFMYPRNNIKADGREVNANTKKSKCGQEK